MRKPVPEQVGLNVDANEVVTPELAAEIRALFVNGQPEPRVDWD